MARFPKSPINEVRQDNANMKYVGEGEFSHGEIGSRPAHMPKEIRAMKMAISHVGKNGSNA